MFTKPQLAAAAAAILVASPALAADPFADQAPGVMFFFSVPLDAKTPKQQTPALGLSFQGERAYQRVTIDTRMFAAYERMGFTGLEAVSTKWIIAGVVAAGATVAVASKDKSTSQQRQEQQQQQQVQQQQQQQEQQTQQNGGGNVPCPQVCAFTGRWF